MVAFIVLDLIYAKFSFILESNVTLTFLHVIHPQEKGLILNSKCTICNSVLFCAFTTLEHLILKTTPLYGDRLGHS